MMTTDLTNQHLCPTCGQVFARAAQLNKHGERKRPCKPPVILTSPPLNLNLSPSPSPTSFRPNSIKFNESLTKTVRQATGIFFTPKKARDLLFQKLTDLGVTAPTRILEPSFGTGEFLLDAQARFPTAELHGVELNEALYKSLVLPTATLVHANFMDWTGTADLIIGNPPYFVVPATAETKRVATGRPNIYILFLRKCLEEHLSPDGHLAFIIPTSLYNCSYYQPMRDYIVANTTIRYVETLNQPGFFETGQETMLIILQKRLPTSLEPMPYLYKGKNGSTYISPDYKELYELTGPATTTIQALGLKVKTGNVVWNQVKESLTSDATGETTKLLIYSRNITGSELCLNNILGTEKKQYVKGLTKPTLDGPVILVERGYGNAVSFNSALVSIKGFYAENHINVIYSVSSEPAALARVLTSLSDARTKRFVSLFNGNGTISGTDLETLIPIY